MDAYEAHPQLLARWNGAGDFKNALRNSFASGIGEGRVILEKLERKEIDVYEAVSRICDLMERTHIATH